MKSNKKTESDLTNLVRLELPAGMDLKYPDLIAAIKESHPTVAILYRAGLSSPELYLGSRDHVFRGLELLRHMYLKPKYLKPN